mmetsp:Transcript_329/g.600  ORF Transcript_329/g.600 Transcript_329/m.600 type:complete len:1288 (+) Transcript_329:87-3950(+)
MEQEEKQLKSHDTNGNHDNMVVAFDQQENIEENDDFDIYSDQLEQLNTSSFEGSSGEYGGELEFDEEEFNEYTEDDLQPYDNENDANFMDEYTDGEEEDGGAQQPYDETPTTENCLSEGLSYEEEKMPQQNRNIPQIEVPERPVEKADGDSEKSYLNLSQSLDTSFLRSPNGVHNPLGIEKEVESPKEKHPHFDGMSSSKEFMKTPEQWKSPHHNRPIPSTTPKSLSKNYWNGLANSEERFHPSLPHLNVSPFRMSMPTSRYFDVKTPNRLDFKKKAPSWDQIDNSVSKTPQVRSTTRDSTSDFVDSQLNALKSKADQKIKLLLTEIHSRSKISDLHDKEIIEKIVSVANMILRASVSDLQDQFSDIMSKLTKMDKNEFHPSTNKIINRLIFIYSSCTRLLEYRRIQANREKMIQKLRNSTSDRFSKKTRRNTINIQNVRSFQNYLNLKESVEKEKSNSIRIKDVSSPDDFDLRNSTQLYLKKPDETEQKVSPTIENSDPTRLLFNSPPKSPEQEQLEPSDIENEYVLVQAPSQEELKESPIHSQKRKSLWKKLVSTFDIFKLTNSTTESNIQNELDGTNNDFIEIGSEVDSQESLDLLTASSMTNQSQFSDDDDLFDAHVEVSQNKEIEEKETETKETNETKDGIEIQLTPPPDAKPLVESPKIKNENLNSSLKRSKRKKKGSSRELILCRICEELIEGNIKEHFKSCRLRHDIENSLINVDEKLRRLGKSMEKRIRFNQNSNYDNELPKPRTLGNEEIEILKNLSELAYSSSNLTHDPQSIASCQEILHKCIQIKEASPQIQVMDKDKLRYAETVKVYCNRIVELIQSKFEIMRKQQEMDVEVVGIHRVSIHDFTILKPISSGAFGTVLLVRKKKTKDLFAVKVLPRSRFSRKKQQSRQIMAERNIMAIASSDFIVNFYYSFQSQSNLYFVMEYCPGGDVFSLLRRHLSNGSAFSVPMARQFLAETVLALLHLHENGIIHRDLKPDNLLICADGHIKLTDFGLSEYGVIQFNDTYDQPLNNSVSSSTDSSLRASSIIRQSKSGRQQNDPKSPTNDSNERFKGTPDYLAPEILLGNEHGEPVDWWALGILVFEFLYGIPPFNADTTQEIFDNILSLNIPWPDDDDEFYSHVPSSAKDLIKKLLVVDPQSRLTGIQVQNHPFFKEVDWSKVKSKTPEYVPELSSASDLSHFEPRHDFYPVSESTVNAAYEDVNRSPLTPTSPNHMTLISPAPLFGQDFVASSYDEIMSPLAGSIDFPFTKLDALAKLTLDVHRPYMSPDSTESLNNN